MDNMIKYFITSLILSITIATTVFAASISVSTPHSISAGTLLTVDIVADTEGESFNAADITITYPPSLMKFRGMKKENSVLSLWISVPHEVSPGTVSFSGVVPGGVERAFDPQHPSDDGVLLARLLFVPVASGTIPIAVTSASLLRNDGTGKSIPLEMRATTVVVTSGISDMPVDTEEPMPFTVSLIDKSPLGESPRLARFEATDGDIEHYEVRINNSHWRPATSPYPLPSRLFGYTFTVRAVDFSGNMRDQSISIPGERTLVSQAILVALFVVVLIIYRRRKKSQ